jgi:hypothetical protein
VPLTVKLVKPSPADPPMQFGIAMATRRGDGDLIKRLNAALAEKQVEIAAILDGYGVPRTDAPPEETQR